MEMDTCVENCTYFSVIILAYRKLDCLDLGSIVKILAGKLSWREKTIDY